jgi:8-oxo-dGTP pyrophosphatase MutT (NUDIX family)
MVLCDMIKPWSKLDSKPLGDFRIFRLRSDLKRSPRTGMEHDFFVIDSVNWVNVVAITTDDHLVMVEQFRHGSETVELEIPGGMVDSEDSSPVIAGVRELREETGYEGEEAEIIGRIYPNPAIMSNTCYTVLVRNCRLKHPTVFDQSEEIITRLVPLKEIPALITAGRISHSLVVVALYHFELRQRRQATLHR